MSSDKFLRYSDLKQRGIVNNHVTLKRWIDAAGFPRGFLLGPNTRVFSENAVNAWIANRPTKNAVARGAAKRRGGRS